MNHNKPHDAIAIAAGWVLDGESQVWYHPTLSPDEGYVDSRTLCDCENLVSIHFHDYEQYIDYTG